MKELSTERRRPRVRTVNTEPGKTVQSDGPRTEIKAILERYAAVGIVDHMRDVDLQFRDVTEFEDFRDLMVQAKDAELAFMKLPPQVRDVFENDPSRWLDAAHDAEKLEALRPKLEKLGVMKAREPVVEKAADGRIKNRRKRAELEVDSSVVERRKPVGSSLVVAPPK